MSNKELTAEQIRPGRTYRPHVDVVETDADIRLWADMPGVDESSVEVHLKEDVLSIEGRVSTEDYTELMPLYTEYKVGNYAQRFAVSPTIDSDAIRATMRHGVLELVLPKLAEARPRRIDVTAS